MKLDDLVADSNGRFENGFEMGFGNRIYRDFPFRRLKIEMLGLRNPVVLAWPINSVSATY